MDEIKRCLEVLGLESGATEDDVKRAYRELAMVWHPDRFPADSPLQAKADNKLKELNAAYEFLLTQGFQDGLLISPEQPASETEASTPSTEFEPAEEGDEPAGSGGKILWLLLVLLLVAGAAWWWFQHQSKPSKQEATQNQASNAMNPVISVVTNSIPASTPKTAVTIVPTNNLLATMRPSGERKISYSSEGAIISGESGLFTRDEYSPPFVIRVVAKTDLTNIRLIYAHGGVILNWEANPTELHVHDPATGQQFGVAGQGRVPVNEWQEIEWRVETNSTSILVNGTERAKFHGNYAALTEVAGIITTLGATVTVQQFEVRKLPSAIQPKLLSPSAGLVLYYPFEADENGIVTDQSGFKNNGTVHGAKFTREGKVGGAMSFSGSQSGGDSIQVPNSASLSLMQRTRHFTLCAWIKPNSLASEYPVLLTKGGNFAPKAFGGFELDLHAWGDSLGFVSGKYALSGPRGNDSWLPKHLKKWTHLAVVINTATGTGKFYVNGERIDDYSFGGNTRDFNFTVMNDLFIGAPDPNHRPDRAWFDGMIDELRIYARALTEEEIRSLPGFEKPGR